MGLHCKLVPVQYPEYEHGLLVENLVLRFLSEPIIAHMRGSSSSQELNQKQSYLALRKFSRRAWRRLDTVTSSPDWLIFVFAFLVIGQI